MRADRLVAILMILQRRGSATAGDLAAELEVSTRTIYRDLDALSAAGIPVYAERGAGGGCRLDPGYRTDLTGLTDGEAGALALLATPGPLDSLEIGRQLRAALRKLAAAAEPRLASHAGQPPVHVDWAPWRRRADAPGRAEALYAAIGQRRRVRVSYEMIGNRALVEQVVNPLGLVAKDGEWHLIIEAHGKRQPLRLAAIRDLAILDDPFAYPADFDLRRYWDDVCATIATDARHFIVRALVAPRVLPLLAAASLDAEPAGEPDGRGWMPIELRFATFAEARARLLSLGGEVEVVDPEPLRRSIADFARQITDLYSTGPESE